METNMHSWMKLLAISAVMAVSTSAIAQEPDQPAEAADSADEADEEGSLILGAKVGGLLPFSGLSANVRGGIEIGYILPWLDRSLAVALAVDYAAPATEEVSVQDPRTPGGSYDWEITEQQLAFMPLAMYRMQGLGKFTPFAGIGPRVYMLRSTVNGSAAGASFGETTEQSTSVGFGIPLGVEFKLGPGALLAELLFEYGGLDHRATGDASTAATSLMVGYRFLLL